MTFAYWLLCCAAAAALFAGFFGGPEYSMLAPVTALAWSGALLYLLRAEAP